MNKDLSKTKKSGIQAEIERHEVQISKYLENIKKEESSNAKKQLYEKILELNNVEEKYIFPYLSLIEDMLKKNEINQEDYNKLLKEYSIYTKKEQCTENGPEKSNYNNNSYKKNGSLNLRVKIKEFLEKLKDKININDCGEKLSFIQFIYRSVRNIQEIDYKAKKRVTLENNEEIYLYIIYCSFVKSLYNRMEEYINKDSQNEKILHLEKYIFYVNKIKEIDDKITKIVSEAEEKTNKIKEEIKKMAENKKKEEENNKIKEKIKDKKEEKKEEENNQIKEETKDKEEEKKEEENKKKKEEVKDKKEEEEENNKKKNGIKNLDELKKLLEFIRNELNDKKEKLETQKRFYDNFRKYVVLLEGSYFIYFVNNLQIFLHLTENNYNKRFKNLDLKDKEDKMLFEYYLLFLGNSKFNEDIYTLAKMWNEFLIPLDDEEIQNKIDKKNQDLYGLVTISFDKKKREINIKLYLNSITIKNIDNYAIFPLINDIISAPIYINLEWSYNKFLKPNKFKSNLFVYKNKDIWENFLINLFNSKTYNDIKFSFYNLKQIDFLSSYSILSDIINNIQFFTFNCVFHGRTIGELFRIYENGIFNKNNNQSISLLIFYAFFILTTLHEIGGHFYVRFQYLYSLNEGFESPDIEENEKSNYTEFGILRGKESGEKLEIKMFGRVINKLTVHEALYILNLSNYSKNIEDFRKNFNDCNKKDINELFDDSLEQFLLSLNIKKNDLLKNSIIGHYYTNTENKELEENKYYEIYSKHSFGLYQEPNKKEIKTMLEILEDEYKNFKKK